MAIGGGGRALRGGLGGGESRLCCSVAAAVTPLSPAARTFFHLPPPTRRTPLQDAAKTAEDVATDYNGGRDLADLVAHVNEGAGTHRAPNGGLLSSAGRLPEFDEIAAKFVAAANKAALVAEATELAAGLKADAAAAKKADAYLKAFAKVAEKGAAWLAKETARLDGMIASEAVAPGKKTEMALKRAWRVAAVGSVEGRRGGGVVRGCGRAQARHAPAF